MRSIKKASGLKERYGLSTKKEGVPIKRKKIAVIGSGPAGMYAALLLTESGFEVELFEKEKQLGGMLRYCLPKFRLSREGIDKNEKKLRELGVKIHLGEAVGKERPLEELAESFDAVLLACGEWKERRLKIKGEKLQGVVHWTKFLRQYNEEKAEKLNRKKAVVIGGGDTAVDCARVALRLGAETTIAYRRSREGMPASKTEIEAAEAEGIEFRFHLNPAAFRGRARLESIVFEKTLGQGREMRPTGKLLEVKADIAIIAAGQLLDQDIFEGSKWKSLEELPEKIVPAGDIANREKRIGAAITSAAEAVEKINKITGN